MQTKNNKIIKLISSFLIIAILMPSFLFLKPEKSHAQAVVSDPGATKAAVVGAVAGKVNAKVNATSLGFKIKETSIAILKQMVITVNKRLMAEMTKSTINWINAGFHGAPLFLENPTSFFRDVGKYEIKNFITMTGYDSNRFPFGKGFALNIIGSYKQKFEDNAQYTLSKVINDPALLQRYRTDFNVGGWNGFLTNTMYPQNNYIGYQMLATERLARKLEGVVETSANKVKKVLDQGMGFLSPQTCPSNPNYNNGKNEFQKPSFQPKTKFNENYSSVAVPELPPPPDLTTPPPRGLPPVNLPPSPFPPPPRGTGSASALDGLLLAVAPRPPAPNIIPPLPPLTLPSGLPLPPTTTPSQRNRTTLPRGYNFDDDTFAGGGTRDPEREAGYRAETIRFNNARAVEKIMWDVNNNCPGGLVATTPGSVIANQIAKAMGARADQTVLGSVVGDSITGLSAIFDALFNKFLGEGLNALATKTNRKPVEEDFEYEGQRLGVADDDVNKPWSTGPDEEISLDVFKKQLDGYTQRVRVGSIIEKDEDGSERNVSVAGQIVIEVGDTRNTIGLGSCSTREKTVQVSKADCDNVSRNLKDANDEIYPPGEWTDGNGKKYIPGDIVNTQREIALIDNRAINDPGIIQMISKTWPEIRELDMCMPGPNMGWKDRLTEEMDRNSSKLQGRMNEQNGEKAAAARLVYNELEFAVKSFKDWIDNKMLMSLGDSQIYMDAIDEIDTLYQQSKEIIDSKRIKNQALARLLSIKADLDKLTDQPEVGSNEEKYLVDLRKKYNPIKISISNSSTIENTLNELSMAKNKYEKTIALVTKCRQERKAKGWEEKGGPNSNLTASGIADKFPTTSGTEQDIFCDAPIKGGYNHKSFTHENDGSSGAFGAILGGYLGAITGGIGIIPGILIGRALGNKPDGIVTHPDVPYVNAKDVLKWRGSLGVFGHSATMKLSCDLIYNTQIVDYKKDLPGLTPVIEAPIIVNDTDIGIRLGTCTLSNPVTPEQKFTESEVSKEDCDSVNGSTWIQSQTEPTTNNEN